MPVLTVLIPALLVTLQTCTAASKGRASTHHTRLAPDGRVIQTCERRRSARRSSSIYRPYVENTLTEAYIFAGAATFGGGRRPAELLPDPAITFGDVEYMAFGIGRAKSGEHGRFSWAWFIYSGTYTLAGKEYKTAAFTQSWGSNLKYCSPEVDSNATLAVPCTPAIFKWEKTGRNAENVLIYSLDDRKNPILTFKGLRQIPFSEFYFPNTALWIAPLSANRLYLMNAFAPLINGYNSDGSPNIVDHVLFDSDFGGPAAVATIDAVEGPAAANFTGWLVPYGLKMLESTTMRIGFPFISPLQQTW